MSQLALGEKAAPLVCQACGGETERLEKRHGGHGLACCPECLPLSGRELTKVYLQRLARAVGDGHG